MFYIPQLQKDDCGFACLKMILATLNKDRNYLFLPQEEDHGFYSYSQLIDIASYHGLNFSAIRSTNKRELCHCTNFPLIASLTLKNGARHAVIVTKAKRKKVTYYDPHYGKTIVKLEKFVEIWDGTALIIESFKKEKYPYEPIEPIKRREKLVLSLIQCLSGIFAVLGVFFIDDKYPIYLPIVFLSLTVFVEIILRLVIAKVMKKLDDYFFDENRIPYDGFRDYLQRYENYKRLSLVSPMNFVLTAVFALGLIFIMLINDYRNIFLVVTPVILSLVRLVYISSVLKKKKREIEEIENKIDGLDSIKEARNLSNLMHKKAYTYGFIDTFTNYAFALIIIAVTLLTMHLSGVSSLPNLFFYACLTVVLYRAFDNLLGYDEKRLDLKIAKARIVNRMKITRK